MQLSKSAYEIGSVLVTGACTVNDLFYSVATEHIPLQDKKEYLRGGLSEICSKRLIKWSYEPDYGNRPCITPLQFNEDEFSRYWNNCFSKVTIIPEVPDAINPTLFLEPLDVLSENLANH